MDNSGCKMATVDLDRLYAETMLKFDHILQAPGKEQLVKQKVSPHNIATEKQCEFCRTSYPSRRLIDHHIVPEDIVQKASLPGDRTIELCFSCHRSLHNWNAHNVSWVRHESEAKRHGAKSLAEVAKEYELAFSNFIEYKFKKSYGTTYTIQQKLEIIGSLRPIA